MILCKSLELLWKNRICSWCTGCLRSRFCILAGNDGTGRALGSSLASRLGSGRGSRIYRSRLCIAGIGCWIGSILKCSRYRFYHLCSFGSLVCIAGIFRYRGSSCPCTENIHQNCNQHKSLHTPGNHPRPRQGPQRAMCAHFNQQLN